MSSMPSLDQMPPPPPDVSTQMGASGSPYSGVSAMMQQKANGQQDGQPPVNPKGSLITMSDAIKKVVDQMSKMEPNFAPFGDRIRSLLDAGVGAAVSGNGPDGSKPSVMSPSQRPGEQGAQAPGAGFPG